jgi:hypothetical protein
MGVEEFRMFRLLRSVFAGWTIRVRFSVGTEIFLFVVCVLTFPGVRTASRCPVVFLPRE